MLSAGIVAKSSVTPLLRSTAMNGPLGGDLKAEQVREEFCGLPVVPGMDDRVVQLD
jgi:hypothetical protein